MLLTGTSDKVQVITGTAVTVDVHASYFDYNGTTVTPDRKNTNITTATTTDVVASPSSSVQRNVKLLTVRNKHATDPVAITIRHTDGTNIVEMFHAVLEADAEVQYTPTLGFLML
jgi:hypothetical protein